jgi:beta-lactamase class A
MSHAIAHVRHSHAKHIHRAVRKFHGVSLRALKIAGWVIVGVTVAITALQLLWPSDRALPFMTLGGQPVGLMHRSTIASNLDNLNQQATVTLRTLSMDHAQTWSEAGITVASEESVNKALHYPLTERLLPFSSIRHIADSREMLLATDVDEPTLQALVSKITIQDRQAAVNAAIKIVGGKVEVKPAQAGYTYDEKDVLEQLRYSAYKDQTVIVLNPKLTPAALSSEAAEKAASQANAIMNTSIMLQAAGHSTVPTAKQIGTWIEFAEQKNSSKLTVVVKQKKVEDYLKNTLAKKVYVAPGTATVRLVDGNETSRTAGSSGLALNVSTSAKLAVDALKQNRSQTIEAPTSTLAPVASYNRNYTFTNKGLQALINYWSDSNYGTYGIVVKDIGGGTGLNASVNADRDFVTASTFKMFLAYAVLNKIDNGKIKFSTKTDMGWTVDACLKEMILNSTNACAISLFNLVGWSYAANFVQNSFPNTQINNATTYDGEKHSTVRDETNFLQRLNAGSLLSSSSRSYLLNLLKTQIYRGGIPAGVPGITVANKVGFYAGYKHDVAIIYAPRGTYILGIMSIGGSDGQFRDLSQQVYNFFNR